jgi:hypothetical protein
MEQIEEIKRSGDPFVCRECGACLVYSVLIEGAYILGERFLLYHASKFLIDHDYASLLLSHSSQNPARSVKTHVLVTTNFRKIGAIMVVTKAISTRTEN